jgi:hypothetical protein
MGADENSPRARHQQITNNNNNNNNNKKCKYHGLKYS